jgi:hypothetical protein
MYPLDALEKLSPAPFSDASIFTDGFPLLSIKRSNTPAGYSFPFSSTGA